MTEREDERNVNKAWVVFSGQADLPWLKILRPGFRHCYVLMNDGRHWITIDPLSNYMDVTVHHLPQDFNLPLWMQDCGYTIVPAQISQTPKQAPWMVFTCVEAVKRVLGLHKRFILTPWQLYCHLRKCRNAQIFNAEHQTTNTDSKGELAWEV